MNKNILTPDQRVRVFVSSTLKELEKERKAVKKAIKDDLKLHPIMFESGASPHPPREKYRSWLEQSDIYIGIFWESYGWIAPDMKISGIEDEYMIAKQRNLQRLVYIKNTVKGRDKQLTELLKIIEEEGTICYKSFDTEKELVDLVKNDIALILSEKYVIAEATHTPKAINYLERIASDISKFGFVERTEALSDIENAVKSYKQILLIGEPGCGKTFLLVKYGTEKNGIYISIRDKTPLEVYTYLTNRLRMTINQLPEKFTSEEEAKYDLEISLQNSKATLLIDDTDQNIIFARSLMGLDYYQNEVIYAARNETVLGSCSLVKVGVQPFTRPKIEAYLKQNNVELSHAKFLELLRACQGNPLYLYFFVNFQIDPLPDGLKAYQDALWRGLNLLQRELLGAIALSLFPPNLNLLHKAYNKLTEKNYSAMEIASVLNELSTIIQIMNGYYEIFHPYFKEAIANEVDRLGLSQSYHRVLGEINFANRRIVEATYHFRKAHDNRADNFLLEATHYALLRGLWDIAEDFLNRQAEISRSKNDVWTEGYTCYHLSFLLRNKGLSKEAEIQIKHAIEAFKTCGDQNWEKYAKIQQYLDWISEGKGISAISAIKELLDIYEGVDPTGKAMILVNLSYAYIQVSQYEEGAEVAKRAYEIFAKEGDFRGLTTSLMNLTGCLVQLDHHDLAKKYAEEIVSLAERLKQPRLKAGGLNHLALSLRKSGDPISARKCLEEAVDICQRLGMVHLEITNIMNLGNTYKDQNDLTNAEKCYQEGLAKAKELGLKNEMGRALELIASLKRRKRDYQGALDFATKAIEIQKEIGDSLRIAESLIERAAAFVALNKNREAAQDYEEAGNNYRTVSKCIDSITSYERASCQWAVLGDEKKSLESLEKAIEYSFQGDKTDVAMSSIEELQKTKMIVGLDIFYLSVIEQYAKASSKSNLAISFYSFASYCKLSNTKEAKNSYVKALKILAGQASKHRNICNTLIAGIEQADEKLLTTVEFELIANCLVDNMDGFYYRKMPEGITIWTTVWQLDQPIIFQIQCFSERLTEKRLSLILMLAVLANKEALCQNIKDLSGFKANSITFAMLGQEEFEEKIQKLPNGVLVDERPSVIMQSGVPCTEEQPLIPIIIHKNYDAFADWSVYPENKAIIWLLMNFYRSIMENITHKRNGEIEKKLAKKAREFCEGIFGYREMDKSESDNAQVRWQIENIKSLIEKFQKMGKNERR